jgi:hypothetical protein
MNGYGDFKYTAKFPFKEKDKFCEVREWCWNQWGASRELNFWDATKNPAWCWTSEYTIQIYFASDAEYQWFLLKWT